MKKKWRTLGAKWFMSYDHSNVICLEEECDLQICHTLATSDEKTERRKEIMFPPQWLLTRYLHFVVAVASEELVTADS